MDDGTRRSEAIEECDRQIEWFLHRKNQALYGYWVCQMAVFVLTAFTPVLILVGGIPKAVQALPAALAAIAAGALGVFQLRDTAGAFAVAGTRLQNELFLFRTRSGIYASGDDPTGRFINSFTLVKSESISGWRERLLAAEPGEKPK